MVDSTFILSQALARFDHAGIRYSLMRDTELAMPYPEELDLLISLNQRNELHDILLELQFFPRRSGSPFKEVFAGFHQNHFYLLDIHYALIQNGLIYHNAETALNRTIKTNDGFAVLAPDDRLIHLFFHSLIGKNHLQSKHLPLLASLLRENPDLEYIHKQLKKSKLIEIFSDFCLNGVRYNSDRDYARSSSNQVKKEMLNAFQGNRLRHYYHRYLMKWPQSRKGISVTFASYHNPEIEQLLTQVCSLLDQSSIIKYRKIINGSFAKSEYGQMNLFTLLSNFIKAWVIFFFKIRPYLRKGRIVLCHGSFLDYFLTTKKPSRRFRCFAALIPKTELLIYPCHGDEQNRSSIGNIIKNAHCLETETSAEEIVQHFMKLYLRNMR